VTQPSWERYHARTLGRRPRPLLLAACDLFGSGEGRTGPRDSWAGTARMSFHNPDQVAELLEGLYVLQLDETERDGDAVSGPKHWHVYDILARQPV
jgi:hypothetical protein